MGWGDIACACLQAVCWLLALGVPAQALIGPHGGGLQNMVFMRQPGHHGVATWRDDATFGTDVGMGPGDPVPAVVELGKALGAADFRGCFVDLANALGLRCSHCCVRLGGGESLRVVRSVFGACPYPGLMGGQAAQRCGVCGS